MPYKIAIIGAGNIGLRLAENLIQLDYQITLFNRPRSSRETEIIDQVDRLNERYGKTIILAFDIDAVVNNDIILFVAGAPRKEGQTRFDLLEMNAHIAKEFSLPLAQNNPNAIIINAINPLDLVTRVMHESLREKKLFNLVIGMGSSLDTKRFNEITEEVVDEVLKKKNVSLKNTYVLGEHGPSMVPILSNATIDNEPLTSLLTTEQIIFITERTKGRGAEIIRLTEHSDIEGPVSRLCEITDTLLNQKSAYIPYCTCREDGVFMGHLGYFNNGTVTPHLLPMSAEEEAQLEISRKKLAEEWQDYITGEKTEKNSEKPQKTYSKNLEKGRHVTKQTLVERRLSERDDPRSRENVTTNSKIQSLMQKNKKKDDS